MSDERRDKSWPQISRCTDLIMPSAYASPHVASWAPALAPCRLVGKVSWESCSAMLLHAWKCLVQPETGLLALGSLRARMRESGVLGASWTVYGHTGPGRNILSEKVVLYVTDLMCRSYLPLKL